MKILKELQNIPYDDIDSINEIINILDKHIYNLQMIQNELYSYILDPDIDSYEFLITFINKKLKGSI